MHKWIKVHLDVFLSVCLGGYREGETPGSIPNPEAKPLIADNTAPFRCGNVGRRLVYGIYSNLYSLYKLNINFKNNYSL